MNMQIFRKAIPFVILLGALFFGYQSLNYIALNKDSVRVASDAPEVLKPFIEGSLERTARFYQEQTGLALKKGVIISAGQNPETLGAIYAQANRPFYSSHFSKSETKRICNRTRRIGGVALSNSILVCFGEDVKLDQLWLNDNQDDIDGLIVHEWMHIVQRQLSGSKTNSSGTTSERRRHGPKWMVEGVANVMADKYMGRQLPVAKEIKRLQFLAKTTKKPLQDLMLRSQLKSTQEYRLGQLASFLLIQKYGLEKNLDYWRVLSSGNSWEDGFKKTYGIELSKFMNDFEQLRKSPNTARLWLEN